MGYIMKRKSINTFVFSMLAVKCTKMLYKYRKLKNGLYNMMITMFKFFKPHFSEIFLFLNYENKDVLKEEMYINDKGCFVGKNIISINHISKKVTEKGEILYRIYERGKDIIIPLMSGKKFLGIIQLTCRDDFEPPKSYCDDLTIMQEILSQGIQYLISRIKINEISGILKKISEINKKFISLIEAPNMEKRLIRILLEEVGFDRVIIYFLDENEKAILYVGIFGKRKIFKYRVSQKKLKEYLYENYKEIPHIHIPIEINSNQKGGVIVDNFLTLIEFTDEIKEFFLELATELSLLFENSDLFKNIKREAVFDHLTGLYRPKYFYDRIDEELKFIEKAAFIYIDFDYFKEINDTYGHLTGDKVLEIAGKIIRKNLRSTDIPCRLGGDEFIIFLPEMDRQKAMKVANRILSHFKNHPIIINQTKLHLSLSAGISIFPDDAKDRETLLALADKALYKAKEMGRGIVFSTEN